MWCFICHYKGHNGTVTVSQYTAPTYRNTADAMRADNPKTEALSSFCTSILYGYLCLCGAWRKLGTAPLTELVLVLVEYSKSGHTKSSRAEEPRALPNLHPIPSSVSFKCYACALRRLLNQCTTPFRTLCNG